MEMLDVVDAGGMPTGETVERSIAHRDGIRHRTAHVWIARRQEGRVQVLLQKRSRNKDSFPGMYDTSSAGHIPAGVEPLPSALREMEEELGICACEDDLVKAGMFTIRYAREFHGEMFRDHEVATVYVYRKKVDADRLVLQESEVESVRWFDLAEVSEGLKQPSSVFCVPQPGLDVLENYLEQGGYLPEA